MKNKEIARLEKKLSKIREDHIDMSRVYGSELCAGDMIRKEKLIEKQIEELKKEEQNENQTRLCK